MFLFRAVFLFGAFVAIFICRKGPGPVPLDCHTFAYYIEWYFAAFLDCARLVEEQPQAHIFQLILEGERWYCSRHSTYTALPCSPSPAFTRFKTTPTPPPPPPPQPAASFSLWSLLSAHVRRVAHIVPRSQRLEVVPALPWPRQQPVC